MAWKGRFVFPNQTSKRTFALWNNIRQLHFRETLRFNEILGLKRCLDLAEPLASSMMTWGWRRVLLLSAKSETELHRELNRALAQPEGPLPCHNRSCPNFRIMLFIKALNGTSTHCRLQQSRAQFQDPGWYLSKILSSCSIPSVQASYIDYISWLLLGISWQLLYPLDICSALSVSERTLGSNDCF